jgi:hypothetical protein
VGQDSGAFAWCGFNAEGAADHFHPFPHADQTETFVRFGAKHAFNLKGFAGVQDAEVTRAPISLKSTELKCLGSIQIERQRRATP